MAARGGAVVFAAQPALFWLDAHWCGSADTAGEGAVSPLSGELASIGSLHPQSVILIDDARAYLCAPPPPGHARELARLSSRHPRPPGP